MLDAHGAMLRPMKLMWARRLACIRKRLNGSSGAALWKEANPTAVRSPGPGPITKRVAQKFLADRNVILHTDGAKTSKMKVPGVLRDNVVRKKNRMLVNCEGKGRMGQTPLHEEVEHKLPTGKSVTVKAGAQIIDRFWGHLRASLKHAPRKVGSVALARKIRAAQWTYLRRTENFWAATGQVLQDLRA